MRDDDLAVLADRHRLENGTDIWVMGKGIPVPPVYEERAETAEKVLIGRMLGNGNACIIAVVGEVAIKVEIGFPEAYFFAGIMTGTAAGAGRTK